MEITMRHILKSLFLSAPLVLAAPMLANATGFESTLSAPVTTPVKLDISLSEDLAYRANNLPKNLSDRGGSSRLASAFGQNGYYGEKDLNRLEERLERKLTSRLEKKGIIVSGTAATVFRVTIVDAANNRPTFEQLSQEPSLSFQSIGIGGAEFAAEILAADGSSLGKINYDWFENDIRDSRFGSTWYDANRAIDRFAKRVAKELTTASQS